jgi:hypothetical protein
MHYGKHVVCVGILVVLGASLCPAADGATSAQDAWKKLVGVGSARRPAFAFVENQPGLPNVLIYGDSISIAYTPVVRQALKGKANVYRIHCNGGDSGSVIAKMDRMHATMRSDELRGRWSFHWDVIHFNVGLHDLKYVSKRGLDTKAGKQVTSPSQYEKNLRAIVAYLKKTAPKATLIYATTTPVPAKSAGRIAGDAARYNAVALKVMQEHPAIAVNDLHAFTKPNHATWWSRPGNVHFNRTGVAAQGNEVARVVRKALLERRAGK